MHPTPHHLPYPTTPPFLSLSTLPAPPLPTPTTPQPIVLTHPTTTFAPTTLETPHTLPYHPYLPLHSYPYPLYLHQPYPPQPPYNPLPLPTLLQTLHPTTLHPTTLPYHPYPPLHLIVVCTVFKWLTSCWEASGPWDNIKNMSSIYLLHMSGCKGYLHTCCLSNLVVNRLVYEGASVVHIVLPDI